MRLRTLGDILVLMIGTASALMGFIIAGIFAGPLLSQLLHLPGASPDVPYLLFAPLSTIPFGLVVLSTARAVKRRQDASLLLTPWHRQVLRAAGWLQVAPGLIFLLLVVLLGLSSDLGLF